MASASAEGEGGEGALTAAQRARMERHRLRARALHDARLVRYGGQPAAAAAGAGVAARALDSGGGFLLEPEGPGGAARPRASQPPAPLVHASEQPRCTECAQLFPHSYLFDTFDCSVCDACRDDAGAHALVPRTEAKSEFLLQDCDLDSRPPPLRCVARRNPHSARAHDMRLYLRAQLEARALLVWGSPAELDAERTRRRERGERARLSAEARRLRELRLAARSSLIARAAAPHAHRWGPEARAARADEYSRACLECGHVETYEKM